MNEETSLPSKQLAQYVIDCFMEHNYNEVEEYIYSDIDDHDIYAGIDISNVVDVSYYPMDNVVSVSGHFPTKVRVGTLPASGGGRLEPPTNPPEPILEDREIQFDLHLDLDACGIINGVIEEI